MARQSVHDYINHRYDRYLDYASYHAALAGIPDEAGDILNTVLLSLLKKDHEHLQGLLDKKKGGYTELDFFVLRMLKLNCHSMTSPYRHKTKDVPKDANTDPWKLDIIDEMEYQADRSSEILAQFSSTRESLSLLNIPQEDKDLFRWVFLADNPIRTFPSDRPYSQNCIRYKEIKEAITGIVAPERIGVISLPECLPKPESETERIRRLAVRFIKAGMLIKREEKCKIERLAVRLLHVRARLKIVVVQRSALQELVNELHC